MDYSFNVKHAKSYGLDEAVMLHNFIFWIRQNKANKRNAHDGRTWTYNKVEAFVELFPFWSVGQIRRILDSLISQGVIVKGNHNARAYDRTCWYALADESLLQLDSPKEDAPICRNQQMEMPKPANASAETGTPIPDLLPDGKQEEREGRPADALLLPVGARAEPVPALPSLLRRIRQEAQARGAPLVIGRDFSAGVSELVKGGATADEILEAFTACIEELPEKATFFPLDFLRWRKASRKREEEDDDGRCPECTSDLTRYVHYCSCSRRVGP